MEEISLRGKKYRLKIQKKAVRSLRLRLRNRNEIEVTVPQLMPMFLVQQFIKNHSEWIEKNNQKIKKNKDLSKLKSIRILGEKYEVEVKKALRESLVIMDKKIFINYSDKRKIKKLIDQKMRPWALRIIKEKINELAGKHQLNYEKISVKNQSSRFGSCSSQGNLNFNWQIILLPMDKFEHVLWHELAHLTVKNHSRDFWNLMAKYDPKYIENRRWLKTQGAKMFLV